MLLNKEQVMQFLPHREPFLFVDSVESVTLPEGVKISKGEAFAKDLVGTKVVAHFEVKADLEILKGHFPGNPILPGVIQVEMMAQAGAFVSMALNNMSIEGVNVETLLLGADSSRFRKPIVPGMKLQIETTMVKSRGQIASYDCEIYSDGVLVSEAKFLAKLVISK